MNTLTESELALLQRELDALRAKVVSELGSDDRDHIVAVRRVATTLAVAGRVLIHVSLEPLGFTLGVASLGLSKILENMEIGHNVIHGQYDFLNDPSLDSRTYEWDFASPAVIWKRAHNVTHHTFTNVVGKDDDFGYTALRFSGDVAWKPSHLVQPISSFVSAVVFDWSVALYDLRLPAYLLPKALRNEELGPARPLGELAGDLAAVAKKAAKGMAKDYVLFPLLAGPFAPKVAVGNALANVVRNLWAYAVIYCGHLTEETRTFREEDLANETRGGFYLRQILGSSNFEAGPLLGIASGHLSHQIEHHLFPDLPAWRYRAMAPEVRRICEAHEIPYHTAPFRTQLASVMRALFTHALPGGAERRGWPTDAAAPKRPSRRAVSEPAKGAPAAA